LQVSFEIEQRFRALAQLINTATDKNLDELLASYLCRLGSVLICGNLERCVELILTTRFASNPAPPQFGTFLKAYFRRGTNYDCEQIRQLLYRFDERRGQAFDSYVEQKEQIKESLSSCYTVRNSVAHGGGQGIGPASLKQYYDASFELIASLEQIIR
jgi:hypothetical protein